MKEPSLNRALNCAVHAAKAAGELMRRNVRSKKKINFATQHDIKLELDVRCQKLIEKTLRATYPQIAVLGEEGVSGDIQAEHRWVVDPIDGTVNFAYGIPHCCVSIALQSGISKLKVPAYPDAAYETVVGVVYDPFCDELWTAVRGGRAYLNGKVIRAETSALRDETREATVQKHVCVEAALRVTDEVRYRDGFVLVIEFHVDVSQRGAELRQSAGSGGASEGQGQQHYTKCASFHHGSAKM